MAHPIRPESYIAMDNFYTVTVYNKGAEVDPPPLPPLRAAGRGPKGTRCVRRWGGSRD